MRFVKTVESILNIPSGFQRVAYLESTGTQYIDTGYKPVPATTKLEFYFSPTNISGNYFLFGARPDTSATGVSTCTAYFSSGAVRQDWAGINASFPTTSIGNKYLYTAYNNTVSLNTDTVTGTGTRSTTRSDYNFLLFTVNTAGTADSRRYIGRVYYAKLWDDGTLVRDFIPCIDPLGRACMYDLVGKKAYYNQGTGEFTVGRQIIPVEYLEGTGTQYIDTGLTKGNSTFTAVNVLAVMSASKNDRQAFAGADWNVSSHITFNPSTKRFDVQNTYSVNYTTTLGTIYIVEAVFGTSDVVLTLKSQDGTQLGTVTRPTMTWTSSNTNTWLIGSIHNKVSQTNLTVRFYSNKIYQGSNIVRDFIPCKDENDVGFMFDTVSGTVYENAGTGAFIIGQNKYKMKLRLIKDNVLPTGYTQVEYLESSGTQYIDTGIKEKSNSQRIICDFQYTKTTNQRLFGCYTNTVFLLAGVSYEGKIRAQWGGGATEKDFSVDVLGRYTIDMNNENSACYLDNTEFFLTPSQTSINTNIFICGLNNNGTFVTSSSSSAKYYSFKIYDNDTLVRNFIPAIDPSGTPCMYDLVSRTPFYNQGTGTFTTGKPVLPMVRFIKDIVPAGYKAVNYLESTGTQYIDTGFIPTINTDVEAYCRWTENGRINTILGGGNAYGNNEILICPNIVSPTNAIIYEKGNANNLRKSNAQNYVNQDHRYRIIGGDCYFDNELVGTYTLSTLSTNNSIYLMSYHRNTGAGEYFIGRFYYTKIWDNNTLVRNFIPVVRLLDNKAGMWDTVTKQFYTTPVGDFITG